MIEASAISELTEKSTRIKVPGLAARLRLARVEHGLSQEEAADRLSLNRRTIHAWESEESQPSTATLDRVASLYERSVDWFLGGWSDVNQGDLELARRIHALPDNYRHVVKRVVEVLEHE